ANVVICFCLGCAGGGALGGIFDIFDLGPLLAADAGRELDFELQVADEELVAVVELGLPFDASAVDQGAITAAKVADGAKAFFDEEDAMMAADQIAMRAQMTIVGAADEKFTDWYLDFLTSGAAGQQFDHQFHTDVSVPLSGLTDLQKIIASDNH